MERVLRTACILMAALLVATTLGPAADREAYAGGGVDYEVTVRNDTKNEFTVILYVSKIYNVDYLNAVLNPGQSHTFHTGALCPSGLYAKTIEQDDSGLKHIYFYTHLLGYEVSGEAAFSACCWSSSWRIVKEGGDYKLKKN